MRLSVVINSVCAGNSHANATVTHVESGKTYNIVLNRQDFVLDYSDISEVREMLNNLIRSRIKESGATTLAAMKTAIESKVFFL